MGPLAVLTVFLSLALVLLNELQRWAELTTPVAGFRALGLSRTPVFALLVAWFVLASVFDTQGSHGVRVTESDDQPPLRDRVELVAQFEKWMAANCATAPADGPLPLVVVAASGGGIRAAYWTGGVLDKLFPPTPVEPPAGSRCARTDGRAPVFAVSGVSGGSLGAVSWLSRPRQADPRSHTRIFGTDHLSGALAWMTFVDLPRSFIGFHGKDRAAVIEESWERKQKELAQGFYATWQQPGTDWIPLALLNGTAVESGCRVLTSPSNWVPSTGRSARPPASDARRTHAPRTCNQERRTKADPPSSTSGADSSAAGRRSGAPPRLCCPRASRTSPLRAGSPPPGATRTPPCRWSTAATSKAPAV